MSSAESKVVVMAVANSPPESRLEWNVYRVWLGMVGVSVIDALEIAGNAKKPGKPKQAKEATNARSPE
jgi:hypothetical protein